jgi:hypothetical protein
MRGAKERAMRHAILLAVAACTAACTAGCVTNPRPPPFSEAQATRVLGCAQLGFRTWADERVPATSLVLQVSMRNRCVEPTPVDWSALRIVAVGPDGDRTEATIYDPRGEIGPLRIDSETVPPSFCASTCRRRPTACAPSAST